MTTMINKSIVGVLLAGGLSRRMFSGGEDAKSAAPSEIDGANKPDAASRPPRDKCLELLDHRPMLAHVIARLGPQVDHLVLNANGDPARFDDFALPVAADPIEGFAGPLAGVLAGMRWTITHHPAATHIISVSTDAPFLPTDLVARLVTCARAQQDGSVVIATSNGNRQPVIGLWPVKHAHDLQTQLENGMRKVLQWTDRHGTALCDFELIDMAGSKIDPFFNANHPHELALARQLLQS